MTAGTIRQHKSVNCLPLCVLLAAFWSCLCQAQFTYIEYNGQIYISAYTGPGGNVTIPDTLDGLPVFMIYSAVFDYNTNITSVSVPSSVTYMGTFYRCSSLTNIFVDPGNTNFSSLNGVLFNKNSTILMRYPEGLKGVYTIPNSVATVDSYAFENCSNLKEITLLNSVTTIKAFAFRGCSSLKTLVFPNSLGSIDSGAFSGCIGLTNFNIPNSLTNLGSAAFGECTSLTQMTIPSSVSSLGGPVFTGCTSLTNISVDPANPYYASVGGVQLDKSLTTIWECPPGFKGSYSIPTSVRWIGSLAFSGCTDLTNVVMPTGLAQIGSGAFAGCLNLKNINIPDTVYEIDSSAFRACGLTSVKIPSGLAYWGGLIFTDCSSLTNIYTGPTSIYFTGTNGVLCTKPLATVLECPEGLSGAFTIPNGTTYIAEGAFSACSNLSNLTAPASLRYIDSGAFNSCSGLTNFTMVSGVTNINTAAFKNCSRLKKLNIPGSVTFLGSQLIDGCYSLTNISVGITNPVYADLAGVLFNKSLTLLLQYPLGLVGNYLIPDGVTNVGSSAFQNCPGLMSVTLPGTIASLGYAVFAQCTNLHQVYFLGDVPKVGSGSGSNDVSTFKSDSGTVFYNPAFSTWPMNFGGWTTVAGLFQTQPRILMPSAGAASPAFHVNIFWATSSIVVAETSTDLQNWSSLTTNFLTNGNLSFADLDWTNYPKRFYRIRSP